MDGNTTLTQHHHQNPCPSQRPILSSSSFNMDTGEGHEGPYVIAHADPSSQGLHYFPFCYSQLHLPHNPIQFIDHKPSPNTSSNSNNSNNNNNNNNNNNSSGEAKGVLDDRKKKRMFSNRESARRSRMRKKQQIENLQYQVDHLQTMNHQLSQKIIYLLECNQQVIQQNSQLKDKVSSLQVALSDLLVPLPHHDHHEAQANHHFSNGLIVQPSAPPPATSGA